MINTNRYQKPLALMFHTLMSIFAFLEITAKHPYPYEVAHLVDSLTLENFIKSRPAK